MRFRLTLTAGAAMVLGTVPLEAQGCSINQAGPGGNCAVNHVVRSIINTVATLDLSIPSTTIAVTPADFQSGSNSAAGPGLTVAANTTWSLGVHATTATWSGPAGTTKPSTDLEIDVGAPVPVVVTTTSQPLTSGAAQAATLVGSNITTAWSFANDPPGTYQLTLVFTLTAP